MAGRQSAFLLLSAVLMNAHSSSSSQSTLSLYWQTSPNSFKDTVMVGGSGLANATVDLCSQQKNSSTPSCAPATVIDSWDQSVKFTLDATCTAPCTANICTPDLSAALTTSTHNGTRQINSNKSGSRCISIPVNQPDVWWMQSDPMYPEDTAACGALVRVFGRSIGWKDGECVSSNETQPIETTMHIEYASKSFAVNAFFGTCYEAAFIIPSSMDGCPASDAAVNTTAYIATPWGESKHFPLAILPASSSPSSQIIDIDKTCAGNITAGLLLAESMSGDKVVMLGSSEYQVTTPLWVPSRTTLQGSGMSNTTVTFTLSKGDKWAVAGNSSWGIENLALTVLEAPAELPAIWAWPRDPREEGLGFRLHGVNVTLLQNNVSNAVKVQSSNFEISFCEFNQLGPCMYPPHSDTSPFQASTTMYFHDVASGWVHQNIGRWKCSWMDLDVSKRIIYEENHIICLESGELPHGNSISVYDWKAHPYSKFWSFSRNIMERPANNSPLNWHQRETVTTDGSGGWGSGPVDKVDDLRVTLAFSLLVNNSCVGGSLIILGGPGAGQIREITGMDLTNPSAPVITIDSAMDAHVTPGKSIVGVVTNTGWKLFTGNHFIWTEVVQWYGVTLHGVMADNKLSNSNVAPGGNAGAASLGGLGHCYYGPGPMYFTEWYGNILDNSNGIGMLDGGASTEPQCEGYEGPFVRWNIARGNSLSGISLSTPDTCATINSTHAYSTDVIAERNTFDCPSGKILPGSPPGTVITCSHCLGNP